VLNKIAKLFGYVFIRIDVLDHVLQQLTVYRAVVNAGLKPGEFVLFDKDAAQIRIETFH
jgi:hypothetical protein